MQPLLVYFFILRIYILFTADGGNDSLAGNPLLVGQESSSEEIQFPANSY